MTKHAGSPFFAEAFGGAGTFQPTVGLVAPFPGPMDPLPATPLPTGGNPGIPAGGLGFTPLPPPTSFPGPGIPAPSFFPQPPTNPFVVGGPLQTTAAAGCELLPTQVLRDACLLGLGLFTGGAAPALPAIPTFGSPTTPVDPSSGGLTPFHAAHFGGVGIQPTLTAVSRFKCPRFANGMGILWQNMQNGVTCLPRGVNGSAFGLFRKNRKEPKPLFSAADGKALKKAAKIDKRLHKVLGKHFRHKRGR